MKRVAILCLTAGCLGSPSDSTPTGSGSPDDPEPAALRLAATPYALRSHFDLSAEAVLPDQAEQVVAVLRELSSNPARALLSHADDAGVPAVELLYAALPGPLADRLEGWINDEIARAVIGNVPVTVFAGQLAALADTALGGFDLTSELTVRGELAVHRLTAIELPDPTQETGRTIAIAIGELPAPVSDVLTQAPELSVDPRRGLALGEQHFGLDYGEYAWQAVEAATRARSGRGVRTALGDAIACPALAAAVANHCLLGVCVGHAAELTDACEAGLDALVDAAHERLAELRFEFLHLASGHARLVDRDGDGIAELIADGTWQAELDLGAGLRRAPARFASAP
jgi:hypothetical protein